MSTERQEAEATTERASEGVYREMYFFTSLEAWRAVG